MVMCVCVCLCLPPYHTWRGSGMVRTRLSAADGGHWAAGYTRSLLHRPGKRLSPPFIVRQFHTRVACRLHRAALPPTKYGTNRFGLSVNVYDEAIVK